MQERKRDITSIGRAVRTVLDQLVPADAASIEEHSTVEGSCRIIVRPRNPRSATIMIETGRDDDWINLTVGSAIPLELHAEGNQYTERPLLGELSALCSAVVDGRFEETRWTVGDSVVKAVGKLDLGDRTVVVNYGSIASWNPLTHKVQTHAKYEPYAAAPVVATGGCE